MPRRHPRPLDPIRLALVITDLDVGGAERALVALATGLDRTRWRPHVFCLGKPGALVEPLRAEGIPTTCLSSDAHRPVKAVVALARAFRDFRPALVQSFLFHANVAARLAALLAGRPWVVGGLRVAEREQQWHLKLDRATAWLSSGSVCVSEGVRRFSVETGRLAPDRLAVIPNGIDPRPFERASKAERAFLGVPETAHLALYVGRCEIQKGLHFLLEAARIVLQSLPDWHLAIAGDGPDRSVFQRVTTGPPFHDRLHWLGRRDDVPALLKAADVLVLPSLWEGMPNVVLEAMAARRAVVATAVEGSEDLVVPGETGWLVPPGDPPRLAEALVEAASDPERLRQFGEAGYARVRASFTLEAVIGAYDRLWSAVLGIDPNRDVTRLSRPRTST
jgi:starch synthase (maltosyl-transferring)